MCACSAGEPAAFSPFSTAGQSSAGNGVGTTGAGETDATGGVLTGSATSDATGATLTSTTGDMVPSATSTGNDDGSSSTGLGPVCGDAVVDVGEACDGADLGGLGCADVDAMFTGGVLACAACAFDTSGCMTAGNPFTICSAANLAIPDDAGPAVVTDTLSIPAAKNFGDVADVDIEVTLNHSYVSDLIIDVVHNGSSVRLWNTQCVAAANLQLTFDDAAGAVDCGALAVGNSFTPSGSLASFNAGTMGGSWAIDISDNAAADTGTLVEWCLSITWQ